MRWAGQSRAGRRAAALAVLALSACSTGPKLQPAPEVPARSPTAGDDLLTIVPAGASVIIEIDADRLRRNPAVGPLAAALVARPDTGEDPELLRLLLGILRHSSSAVIAVYEAGKDDARTLVLLRELDADGARTATRIDPRTHALGPPPLIERARELAGGMPRQSAADDPAWLAMRARAMPEKAPGAWLRVTARLNFDARVELAARFELEAVPERLSMWADVADDLAVVALLGGENAKEARALADAVRAAADRVRRAPAAARILLAPVVRGLTVSSTGPVAKATVVIGPRQLAALVERLVAMLGAPPPPEPKPPETPVTPPAADAGVGS